ncbi:hypothetical protein [Nitrospirillum viridazoti]|uniref:Plasmid stability protein n=1 Tax=Nitrospirillum amazonense TaxID=28077 RepID=A0A560HUH4_9PROT|nr:hypothetical protein [Nitrospirillum amazonense]TWB49601.1 hypothetical protein FBZ92_12535 [Nitrospirillum amazonense]
MVQKPVGPERLVKSETRLRLGDALAALSRKAGLRNEDPTVLDAVRDTAPAKPLTFD